LLHAPHLDAPATLDADVPFSYVVLGLGLVWFVRRSDRTALIGAGVAYVVGVLALALVVTTPEGANSTGPTGLSGDVALTDAGLRGTFIHAAVVRLDAVPTGLTVQAFLDWSLAFAMFLLGLVAGRRAWSYGRRPPLRRVERAGA
jgi:uncharacterized membrane protein YeiB